MRLGISRGASAASAVWYLAIIALGVAVFVCLAYFGIKIEILVLFATILLCGLFIAGQPAYRIVFSAIFLSVLLNALNYTVFSFNAEGVQVSRGAETQMFALLRLPILAFGVGLVVARFGSDFIYYLRRNWDVTILSLVPFVSVWFAIDKSAALQYALWFFLAIQAIMAFMYCLANYVPAMRWSEHVAWLLLLSNIFVVALAVSGLQDYHGGGMLRTAYSASNIHTKACMVVIAALLVLELQRRGGMASRFLQRIPFVLILGIGAVSLIALLLGAKRSPIIAVGVTLALYTFSSTGNTAHRKTASIVRTLLLVVPLAYLAWQVLPQAETTIRRFDKTGDLQEDQSTQDRLDVWANAVETMKEYPVFGVGLDNGSLASTVVTPASEVAGFGLHNTYLAILVELGVVGAFLFLVVLARSFSAFRRRCHPSYRWAIVLLGCGPVLLGMVEYDLTPGQFTFWPLWIAILLPRIGLVETSAERYEARNMSAYAGGREVSDYDNLRQ